MGEGRRDLLFWLDGRESEDLSCFLLRAAARTAAVVEPEVLAKSAKPRKPEVLMVVLVWTCDVAWEIMG